MVINFRCSGQVSINEGVRMNYLADVERYFLLKADVRVDM